jgi:tetratricopeptide (TPR) repeat protein
MEAATVEPPAFGSAQQCVAAAATLLNAGQSDADFADAAALFEQALAMEPSLPAAGYGLTQCKRALGNAGDRPADAAVLAEAGATLLNAATLPDHFDDAIQQFEEALNMSQSCELAQYGLLQARKGRDLAAQMRQEAPQTRKWSLRAGRSAAAASVGLDKLRQDMRSAAHRSMAELSELAAGDPPPLVLGSALEPEPECDAELEHYVGPAEGGLVRTNSEDVKVEFFLSRMDEMMQELGDDDDDTPTNLTLTAGSRLPPGAAIE